MSLGTLEFEILNAIWELQACDEDANISVKEVVAYLDENKIERAYTTVKTVMDRLSIKELLIRYRDGKKFYYKSVMDRNEMAHKAIEEISNQFFNGNHINLIRFIEKNYAVISE